MAIEDGEDRSTLQDPLAHGVGRCLTLWSGLEMMLLGACSFALGKTPGETGRLMSVMLSFSAKLQFVDIAMSDWLEKTGRSPRFWKSLVEYIRELSGDRNFIAHVPILIHTGENNEVTGVFIGPSPDTMWGGNEKRDPMDLNEVLEVYQDIRQASLFLTTFMSALQLDEASPEIFGLPIGRRRPSVGTRREERRKAHPPQPQEPRN